MIISPPGRSAEPAAGEPDCKVKVCPGLRPVLRSKAIVPPVVPGRRLFEPSDTAGNIAGSTMEIRLDGNRPVIPVNGLAYRIIPAVALTVAVKCKFTQMLSANANCFEIALL